MNTEEATPQGRRVQPRRSAADRERLIREYEQSGLSRKQFCAQRGLVLTTFHGWYKKRKKQTPPELVEVSLPVGSSGGIEIDLPGGVRVHVPLGCDAERTAALVRGIAGC